MSMTIATIADALIEFILSLLRDPDAAAEFDEDPDAALASRGLSQVRAEDVCAVAPVIAERESVAPAVAVSASPAAAPHSGGPSPRPLEADPVIREIRTIMNNMTYVDDRDTVVDMSVNQNIWAGGDVTQTFDQEAVVASGDGAISAGEDIDIDQTDDNSTTINAGGDVNIGNDTAVTVVEDSFNEQTDASTTTDSSTTTTVDGSFNDDSTTTSAADTTTAPPQPEPVAAPPADDPVQASAVVYTEAVAEPESADTYDSGDVAAADPAANDEF
jgi:hypothetical protein